MRLSIFFLRHGQTTASKGDLFSGSGMNPGLTPEGHEMAVSFAKAYAKLPWAAVYASPLARAIQTAEPLCTAIGKKPELRDGIKEIHYGEWDGNNKEYAETKFHDDYIKWNADPAWNAPTGGESAIAIAARARPVIEEIRATYKEGNVLVVSHKATIRIMLCALMGIELSRFRDRLDCPVGSMSIVEFGSRGPQLKALADRSHQDERLRNLPGT